MEEGREESTSLISGGSLPTYGSSDSSGTKITDVTDDLKTLEEKVQFLAEKNLLPKKLLEEYERLLCPITRELIQNPYRILDKNGQIENGYYEKTALRKVTVSPTTRATIKKRVADVYTYNSSLDCLKAQIEKRYAKAKNAGSEEAAEKGSFFPQRRWSR